MTYAFKKMKMPIFFLSHTQLQNSFRNDINALRAWAVLAVVFYHFGVPGFSGGFVGVDVFFVISGFLMTGIIVKGLENTNFSLLNFYLARVRRILPGLIGLCVAVILVGWVLLAPDDYIKMSEHVQDALLFKSNNTFRKEAGYFDVASHDKWLLHTWSLSVEWQFYIILPLLIYPLWLITKSKKWIFIFFIVLALSALFSCINKTGVDSAKAFYMLKYRSWEMIFGGLIYFLSEYNFLSANKRRALFYAGSVLIIYSVFFIDSEDSWPGYLAIIPVSGASFVVLSSEKNIWVNRLQCFQWVGFRSYSIYLWHWPIVVLLAYFQKSESVEWIFIGMAFSLFIGNFSYLFIENPFRSSEGNNKFLSAVLIIAIAAMVYFIAGYIVKSLGFPMRVDNQVIQISDEQRNTAKDFHNCIYGENKELGALSCVLGGNSIRAIVLGDSHAGAVATAVQSAINQSDAGIYIWTRAACPFIRGVTAKIRTDCDAYVPWVFDKLKAEPKNIPIVLITRGSLYAFGGNEGVVGNKVKKPPVFFDKPYDFPAPEFLKEFKDRSVSTICELAADRKLYLVRPIPEMKFSVPQIMARHKMMGIEKRVSISMDEYRSRHQFILDLQDEARLRCGVEILDPVPYLCDKNSCYGDLNGRPLYSDDDHLSEFGNKLLVPMFSKMFIGE